jgi:polysaccharide export outer membrane protein
VRGKDDGKSYGVRRLRDLIKRGDISANVEVRPGDVLIIPQSWF